MDSSKGFRHSKSLAPLPALSTACRGNGHTFEPLEHRRLLSSTVYVSPRGSNSSPGTRTAPWQTIQYAADHAKAGQTVVILAGVYSERVNVHVNGSKSKGVITFRGNNGAILDGTGVPGQHLIYVSGKQYLTFSGLELRNNLAVDDGSAFRLEGWGKKITIRGNTIHHTTGQNAMAVTVYGSDARHGFSSITIDENTVYDCQSAPSETITLNGNVDGFAVQNNIIHDVNNIGIDAIGGEGTCRDKTLDIARNGTIAGNTVTNVRSTYEDGYAAGIYVDGGRDIVIERNRVSDSDLGIEVGAENKGIVSTNVTVRDNLLEHNDKAGLAIGGYDKNVGRVANALVRNNTFISNDQAHAGNGEIWVQYANDCIFENNAVLTNSQALAVNVVDGTTGIVFDYNVFGTSSAKPVIFGTQTNSALSFSAWQKLGRDGHSVVGEPKFVDGTNDDFTPAADSPLIDAANPGTKVDSNELDLLGHKRRDGPLDVGAIEH